MTTTLNVSGMTCGHCRAAVEKAILQAGGQATVDLTAGTVAVTGLDAHEAAGAIRAAGYEVAEPEAPAAHPDLPS